jgi:uncharacterized protein (TIGR03067 family)
VEARLLLTVALGLLATTATGLDEEKRERQTLQGTWRFVKSSATTKALDQEFAARGTIVFRGDRFIVSLGNQKLVENRFKLHPGRNPRGIDATPLDGPLKGFTYQGIYTLEGGLLKLHFKDPGKKRPPRWPSGSPKKRTVILERVP